MVLFAALPPEHVEATPSDARVAPTGLILPHKKQVRALPDPPRSQLSLHNRLHLSDSLQRPSCTNLSRCNSTRIPVSFPRFTFPSVMFATNISQSELIVTLAGLSALAFAFSVCSFYPRRHRYPPGPPARPIIGNILDVSPQGAWIRLFEYQKKYGPPPTSSFSVAP